MQSKTVFSFVFVAVQHNLKKPIQFPLVMTADKINLLMKEYVAK